MKFHKIFILVLVVTLTIVVIGACDNNDIRAQSDDSIKLESALSESSSEPDINSQDHFDDISSGYQNSVSSNNTLVIRTFSADLLLDMNNLLAEYRRLHPEVTINLQSEIEENKYWDMTNQQIENCNADYVNQISTDIENGNADYLLASPSSELDLLSMSDSGLILDMRDYFESDPDINPNDYFVNIIEAMAVDGKLAVMPYSFYYDMCYLNGTVLNELNIDPDSFSTIDSTKLLELYEIALQKKPDLNLLFTMPQKENLFQIEKTSFINLDEGTCSFDSPEFINFLKKSNLINNSEPNLDLDTETNPYAALFDERIRYEMGDERADTAFQIHTSYLNVGINSQNALATIESDAFDFRSNYAYVYELYDQPMKYAKGPYMLMNSSGKLGVGSLETFVIPSSCKSTDLAWDFIKFCLSNREDVTVKDKNKGRIAYTMYIPINKNNFERMIELYEPGFDREWEFGRESFIYPFDTEKVKKKMHAVLSMESSDYVFSKLYSFESGDILDDFYYEGVLSAEDCAKELQAIAEAWVNN